MKLKDIIERPGSRFCFIDDINNGRLEASYMVLFPGIVIQSIVNLQSGKIYGFGEDQGAMEDKDIIEIV